MAIEITGLVELDAFLASFGEDVLLEAAALLYQRGEAIMTDSKAHYVPVDQSTLQGTGHVEPAVIEGQSISVRLAYGGPGADYAEAIHEHLSEHSPPSWRTAEAAGRPVHFTQGGPKYLELPFMEGTSNLDEYLAEGLKDRFGL